MRDLTKGQVPNKLILLRRCQAIRKYREVCGPQYVALPRAQIGQLRSLLREVCDVFKQKSIYLSIAGHVEFIKRRTHENK